MTIGDDGIASICMGKEHVGSPCENCGMVVVPPRPPMSEAEVKTEIMRKIRKVGYEKLERYYGKCIDESICQPPFFAPDEIEAIIYDKPLPQEA